MDVNNKTEEPPIKKGDLIAARNTHAQLHALLSFICSDQLIPYQNLAAEEQENLLRLAHSTSQSLGEFIGSSPII